MLTRIALCGFAIGARLVELDFSRRNIRSYAKMAEGTWSRRTFPGVVMLHASVLLGTLIFGGWPRWPLVSLFLAVQPLRVWVLLTLGRRWNARGVVPAMMQVATKGPYAFVRHPNYVIVVVEMLSLPAAFGLFRLALIASAMNALLLAVRIRDEERLLMRMPPYREHFAQKPRFLPFLF